MRPFFEQFRLLIAALLLAAVPFCCCEGRALTRSIEAVAASGSAIMVGHESRPWGLASTQKDRMGCCGGSQADEVMRPCESEHSRPCGHDDPCRCAQHTIVKDLPGHPPAIGFVSNALGIVPVVAILPPCGTGPTSVLLRPGAIPKPPTSLLRLHCALMI